MELHLRGKTAVVVGASRGIGRAIALGLAREGVATALWARSEGRLRDAAEACRAAGAPAHAVVADVRDSDARARAWDESVARLGHVELLILNAAGWYRPEKLHAVAPGFISESLAVDVAPAAELCRRALAGMMEKRFGRIVAVGSLAARTGISGGTLYAAGKAALEGLMRGIALDYSRRGVTANVVSVAFADTERLAERLGGDASRREQLERATATRRIPSPEELADVVTFLCSPRASTITGAVVDATAGAHLANL